MHTAYLSNEEFLSVYDKVPRLCVDLVIQSEEGVLLALRATDPFKGLWSLPGGTLYKGECVLEACLRITKKETGLDINVVGCIGYIEYMHEDRSSIDIHSVSIVIQVTVQGGILKHDGNASDIRFFKDIPQDCLPEQRDFLKHQ